MNLVSIADLSSADVRAIWELARAPAQVLRGNVAWSFEGNGIRTRTSFIEAFRELGLDYIELPNLLKTGERTRDLAGYLDRFYAIYVVRESNHARLREFALASARPVVNAMSRVEHPCEVLTDACFLDARAGGIDRLRVGLWGPSTNVFESWHQLAGVLGLEIVHLCPREGHRDVPGVRFTHECAAPLDLLVTDGWPDDFDDRAWSLTPEHLARLGHPELLPTPPFSIGREISFDPVSYTGFVGYAEKDLLAPVQRAILTYLLGAGER